MKHDAMKRLLLLLILVSAGFGAGANEVVLNGITYYVQGTTMVAMSYDGTTPVVEVPATYNYVEYGIPTLCDVECNISFEGQTSLREFVVLEDDTNGYMTSAITSSFAGCTGLEKVVLPGCQEEIFEKQFYDCPNLDPNNVWVSVNKVGDKAFALSEPKEYALFQPGEHIIWPGMTSSVFENRLYKRYRGMEGNDGALGCLNKSVMKSILTYSDFSLGSSSVLESIEVGGSLSLSSMWGSASDFEKLVSIRLIGGASGRSVDIYNCSSISNLTFPNGEYSSIKIENCPALTDITFGNGNIASLAINKCAGIGQLDLKNNVKSLTLQSLGALTTLTGLDSVEEIVNLKNIAVESLSLPAVKEIYSIMSCKNLKDVYFGESLQKATSETFDNCKNIDNLVYGGTLEQWNSIEFTIQDVSPEDGILYNVKNFWYGDGSNKTNLLTELTESSLGNATEVSTGAFTGYRGLTKVNLGSNITKIGRYAFAVCSALEEVSVNAETIEAFAFFNNSMKVLRLGSPIKRISAVFGKLNPKIDTYYAGDWREWGNVVRTMNDEDDVQIGDFASCDVIGQSDNFYFNGRLLEVLDLKSGDKVEDLAKLTSLKGISIVVNAQYQPVEIGPWALSGCVNLQYVRISGLSSSQRREAGEANGGVVLGEYAFSGCSSLSELGILNNLTSIGSEAFRGTQWYASQPDGPIYFNTSQNGRVLYAPYKGVAPQGYALDVEPGTEVILDWHEGSDDNTTGISSLSLPEGLRVLGNIFSSETELSGTLSLPASLESVKLPYGKFDKISFEESATPLTDVSNATITPTTLDLYYGRDVLTPDKDIITPAYRIECTRSMTLGKNITVVGRHFSPGCSTLKSVICNAVEPPVLLKFFEMSTSTMDNAFTVVDKNTCTLNVPENSENAYRSAYGWDEFYHITSGIESPDYNPAAGYEGCEIYTIGGIRLNVAIDQLPAGIYVVRKDGRSEKIVVRQ